MFELGKKGEKGQEVPSREAPPRAASTTEFQSAPRPSAASVSREAAVIGPSIFIDGDLRGDEDLLIEGEVNGTVQLKNNTLTIGSQGKVKADVYAHSVNVEGYVEGDLYGSERVSIRKSAQVRGKITSPRVSLEEGAKYKGSIEMDPETVDASLGTRRNASPKGASVATGASAGAASSGPAKLNGDGLDKSSGGAVKDSAAKRGTVG